MFRARRTGDLERMGDLFIIRLLFIAVLGFAAYFLHPFNLEGPLAAGVGVVSGLGVVLFEIRIKQVSMPRLIGAVFGSVLGILGAYLISLVMDRAMPDSDNTIPYLEVLVLALMTYCGLVVGAAKGETLNLAALGGLFGERKPPRIPSRFWIPASLSTAASRISPRPGSSTARW